MDAITDVPIAAVATLWSDNVTGMAYILVLQETLFFGASMDHSLINPNQLRKYGIAVFDNPYDTDETRPLSILLDDGSCIPFSSQGLTVFFETRFPSDEDLEMYPHIVLTSDHLWDPHTLVMPGGMTVNQSMNDALLVQHVQTITPHRIKHHHRLYETDCISYSFSGNTEQLLYKRMISRMSTIPPWLAKELHSRTRHLIHMPEHVAQIFNVGLGMANTILATTTQ